MKRILFLCAMAIFAFACNNDGGGEEPNADSYSILVTGGTASVNGIDTSEAAEGDEVSLIPESREGYVFVRWESYFVEIIDNTFTMPSHDVTVEAVFAKEGSVKVEPTGSVTIKFPTYPGDAPYVRWAEGAFAHMKEEQAVGELQIPTHEGFVEVSFVDDREMSAGKFLLREGDVVQVKGTLLYPTITSLVDSSFDDIYNFPNSVGKLSLSPDFYVFDKFRTQHGMPSDLTPSIRAYLEGYRSAFMEALETTVMPDEYKHYYAEGYFAPEEIEFNDVLISYISNRQWVVTYSDSYLSELMRIGGGAMRLSDVVNLFDELAEANIPIVSKAVALWNVLNVGLRSFTGIADLQEEYFNKYMAITGDSDAPRQNPLSLDPDEVHLEDAEGNPETLSAILERSEGKLVYVDFWASWCGPCLNAMPASKELRAKYPDVVFVYISIDSTLKSWRGKNEELELPNSYVLINSKASTFILGLRMYSIPRYLLFGRDGEMLTNRAPGPSSVERLFNRY